MKLTNKTDYNERSVNLSDASELYINTLRKLCSEYKIKWTIHVLKRIRERKLTIEMAVNAVMNGDIIEQYPDDKPFPSCLILQIGYNKPIHVVVSTDGEHVYFITAYAPNLIEWEDDYKTRRR